MRFQDLVEGYHLGVKTSTRIIDYDFKCCMVEQKCKNNISAYYKELEVEKDMVITIC